MRAPEDRPPVEFWEDALEFPVTRLVENAKSSQFMNDWVQRRGPRQVAMLRHLLGLPAGAPLRERKEELRDRREELVRFVPAATFASRKSMLATLDVAGGCLDEAEIAIAQDGHERYDTMALVFAILHRSWPELEKVFHLDKLHKVGFERMRLDKPPRRPPRRFKEFLASGELQAVLGRYDADQRDRHTSDLRQVIELRGAEVVFIRRPHQESYLLTGERVVHGFTPDQIVLDFAYDLGLKHSARPLGHRKLTAALVILREFGADLQEHHLSIVDFLERDARSRYQLQPPVGAFSQLLRQERLLVIFDGLDELLDTFERRRVTEAVEAFCNLYLSRLTVAQ